MGGTSTDSHLVTNFVHPSINSDMNRALLLPFLPTDISTTVKSMAPLKASGKDGFPALFYQRYWSIIGKKVTEFCLSILNTNVDLRCINEAILFFSQMWTPLPP
ncbi:hypothetical protein V6N13_000142 [Hibiscus sabdariffa]